MNIKIEYPNTKKQELSNKELQSTVRRGKKLYCDMIKLSKIEIDWEK